MLCGAQQQYIGEKIGRGAFAQVFKARWGETGFFVAVKKFDMSQVAKDTIDSVLVCHNCHAAAAMHRRPQHALIVCLCLRCACLRG